MQTPPPSYRDQNEERKEDITIVQQNYTNHNQQQVPHVPQPAYWSIQNQVHPSGQGCPQVLYACAPPTTNGYQKYKGCQSMCNGVLQILIGLLCIGFNAAAIQVGIGQHYRLLESVSYGIWGGAIMIVAGSFGLAAGKHKNKCLIVTFMVLCIVSCAACAVIASMTIVNIIYASEDRYELITSLNGVLLTLSVIETAIGIWGSVNCCAAACCGAPTQPMYLGSNPNQYNQGNTRIIVVDNLQALNPALLQQLQQGYPNAPTATNF